MRWLKWKQCPLLLEQQPSGGWALQWYATTRATQELGANAKRPQDRLTREFAYKIWALTLHDSLSFSFARSQITGKEEAAAGLYTQNGGGRVSQAPVEGVSLCSASGLCRKTKNTVGEKRKLLQPTSHPPHPHVWPLPRLPASLHASMALPPT